MRGNWKNRIIFNKALIDTCFGYVSISALFDG